MGKKKRLFMYLPTRQQLREAKKGIKSMEGKELNTRSKNALIKYYERIKFIYMLDVKPLHSSKVRCDVRTKYKFINKPVNN